jgi:hypothetical protein
MQGGQRAGLGIDVADQPARLVHQGPGSADRSCTKVAAVPDLRSANAAPQLALVDHLARCDQAAGADETVSIQLPRHRVPGIMSV